MARITYGALVDTIRGSIGGTTFQKNAYGHTVKRKPNMVRPWTKFQLEMQQYFAQAVKAWKLADSTTKDNWNTWASTNPQYAKHNPSAQLSGFACFVKWTAFELLGSGTVDTAPELTIPEAPPLTLKIVNYDDELTLSVTCPGGAEDWNLALFMSNPFGSAQNFIGTKTRYIAKYTDVTQDHDITAAYTNRWGRLPAVGSRVAVDYVRFMESGGQVNSRIQVLVTVTNS